MTQWVTSAGEAPGSDEIAAAPSSAQKSEAGAGLGRSGISWALFQAFRDPYLGLVGAFIFMPYFATVLIPDPVAGQAAVATIGKIAGLIVAIVTPLLGASIDFIGPRKPMLAGCAMVMIPLTICLWFAAPAGNGLPVSAVMAILVCNLVLFNMMEVLFSAMLPYAVSPVMRPRASGLAFSLGNVVSFAMTAFLLWGFALPGIVHVPGLPGSPLFGLSQAAHEPSRIVGPIVGASFALGALPLFLFARDAPRAARRSGGGILSPFRDLWHVVSDFRRNRDVLTYIAVRTVSQDASTVLLTMGGVFAAGVMKWGATEMMVYGLLTTLGGVVAGILAGALDMRLGPKRALQIELAGALAMLIALLGTSRTTILFLFHAPDIAAPIAGLPIFSSPAEILFLGIAVLGLIFQIASWSSARTLLVELAPPEMVGSCFGLASFAAAMTGWMGPMLVSLSTIIWGSQRAGMVPVACLLAVGLAGLFLVRGGHRRR